MNTLEELLDRVVVCPSGCWLWTGADSGSAGRGGGYAKMSRHIDGVEMWIYVHRWVYEKFVEPIPDGYHVDHKCTCWSAFPRVTRRCIRPEHLEAVPPIENQRRKRR